MVTSRNVTGSNAETPSARGGLWFAALGVLGFSFTLPATELAIADLDPFVVAFGRALVAAVLAAAFLGAIRARRPSRFQLRRLCLVSAGVVIGFPLFTSLALVTQSSSHGAIVVGVLPAATAIWGVRRADERPSRQFWLAAGCGFVSVVAFAAVQGAGTLAVGDLFLLAAVALGALGYAEGGALSRELGGSRTICWALLLALPVVVPIVVATVATTGLNASAQAWGGFLYVSVISMLLAFFAWYAGLARGGVARGSQIQLVQPLLTLAWAAALLGEAVGPATLLAAVAVLASLAGTQLARIDRRSVAASGPPPRVAPPRPDPAADESDLGREEARSDDSGRTGSRT